MFTTLTNEQRIGLIRTLEEDDATAYGIYPDEDQDGYDTLDDSMLLHLAECQGLDISDYTG